VNIGQRELAEIQQRLRTIVEDTMPALEKEVEAAGAPPVQETQN
jgi:hypothetical protein